MAWETWVQSQVKSYQKTQKMVLDASLLNTQHHKVQIKSKVGQSRERSTFLPYILAVENGAFGSPFTTTKAGLSSEFSFFQTGFHTKVKETSLCCYLAIFVERTDAFIPFSRELVQREMQSATSRM